MPYQYNPHRHVKIWFSKDKDSFLNIENQLRLIKMREINPEDEIHFIYDHRLLTPAALDKLNLFCQKYRLIPKDMEQDIIPACHTQEELNLISIYQEEITHLQDGGNLAVASDITRWLQPVYTLGTYADFDVFVDTRQAPLIVLIEKPLLLSLGSVKISMDLESIVLNNDTIAVADIDDALADIQKIQRTIYAYCLRPSENNSGYYIYARVNDLNTCQILQAYFHISNGSNGREARSRIMEITKDNLSMARFLSPLNIPEDCLINHAASVNRSGMVMANVLSPNASLDSFISIEDNEAFIQKLRLDLRLKFLKESVVHSSGPSALIMALFRPFIYPASDIEEISLSSFANYGLNKVFVSKNYFPFHCSSEEVMHVLTTNKIGALCDASWLDEGQKEVRAREENISKATVTIQRFYHRNKDLSRQHLPNDFLEMRNKIQQHILKIESDLAGTFGFYRQHQRCEKIKALKGILSHFDEHHFNVNAFKSALESYCSKDIFASFGKSRTKELIDEVTLFSRRAKAYSLTDEQGKFNLI